LADYATLITDLKAQLNAEECPLIAFGGSYGGMLSAWFRMKYPWHVDGSLAASAPILQFEGTGVSQWIFNELITDDFTNADPQCSSGVRKAFEQILEMGESSSGLQDLTEIFKTCTPLENMDDVNNYLINWLETGIGFLAMVDYPYPANFLEPLPAWPVNVFCDEMVMGDEAVESLANAIAVYYNYSGQAGECNNLNVTATPALGTTSWNYQACTEMIMPISSNGTSDMFPPSFFDLESYSVGCQQSFGVTPRADWIPINFGGMNIGAASNIIFSNGMLDPWRGGGVQVTISDSLIAILIEQAAHHLDLREPNSADPLPVKVARDMEETIIALWIADAFKAKRNLHVH